MCGFIKKIFRLGAITAGVLGLTTIAAYAALGESRTKAMVHQMHGKVLERIDKEIEDPTALRGQLGEMEREYPERIAQVRADLAELDGEIRGLEREQAVSERVVALVDQDLGRLQGELASAVSPEGTNGTSALVAVRAVRVDDEVLSPKRAQSKLRQMQEQRLVYANRAADAEHDMLYLQKQRERLEELLTKLETERAEFQAQIQGLSRQIDAIARNDRLIKLLERRNRTIEECSRYDCSSLDQLTGRLSQIRTRQEAELEQLSNGDERGDYEDLARMQLESGVDVEADETSVEQLAGARVLERYGD